MAGGVADLLDVGRAEALLHVGEARRGRLLAAEEVGLERLHPGGREQHRGVVRRRARARPRARSGAPAPRRRRGRCRGSPAPSSCREPKANAAVTAASGRRRRSCRGRRSPRRPAGPPSGPGGRREAARRARPPARVVARRRRRDRGGDQARVVAQRTGRRWRRRGAGRRRGCARVRVSSSSRAPTVTVFAVGVGGEHVERLGSGDADPAALADREVVVARVTADRAAGAIEHARPRDRAGRRGGGGTPLALAGEEAEVLALGLAGDGEAVAGGDLPHLGLGQLGEREAQPPSSSGGSAASM